jgi:hypothetical protein
MLANRSELGSYGPRCALRQPSAIGDCDWRFQCRPRYRGDLLTLAGALVLRLPLRKRTALVLIFGIGFG